VRGSPRHGARDYAMLLLMARLGLRAFEVIAMQLDDIDWRAGELPRSGQDAAVDLRPARTDLLDPVATRKTDAGQAGGSKGSSGNGKDRSCPLIATVIVASDESDGFKAFKDDL
jgi:integrase